MPDDQPLEIEFLTFETVIEIHDQAIREFGQGEYGFLDPYVAESATMQPSGGHQGGYHFEFPAGMAAAYIWYLAKQQGFRNGNKRAAVGSALEFLARNGYRLEADRRELYEMTVTLAGEDAAGTREENLPKIQQWIEKRLETMT